MSSVPSIGEVVRQWRRFHKLNVTEFAKRAGLSKGYISELENNKIENPSSRNMEKLAAATGISVLDLHARRIPSVQSPQADSPSSAEPAAASQEQDYESWQGAGFSFASPLKSDRHVHIKEQLQRVLAHVDELRGMIARMIDERE